MTVPLATAPAQPLPDGVGDVGGAERLYVYYRVPESQLALVLAQVCAVQQHVISAHAGLQAEVLRRPELREGDVTLMEAYTEARPGALTEAFIAALTVQASTLPQPRHTERFTRLA